ncbi:membrane protein [Paraburkholderia caffeinilytica]|uniref:Uncharacterized protein n=1 Tax=Paraburkholderia caffeinilytica TaxID=1761016 RepID=A0ABQ1MLW0_9BURK|nr:membrane protein [Paraburkholderia caffeinilytica]GGC41029.1 hypothetical protein GCM10011400_29740 [Paraburkholderia caffeinilytica]CAB3787614.1 hypothetical protein LMG28690_02480 [Paraburkholderia caffeinilytica]
MPTVACGRRNCGAGDSFRRHSGPPVSGDPLTVLAGFMREPFPRFMLLVTIAKAGRYMLLTAVILQFM